MSYKNLQILIDFSMSITNGAVGGGDSGGPFFLDGDIVIGVVSFSFNDFDLFIRVDRYLDWISSFTGVQIPDS